MTTNSIKLAHIDHGFYRVSDRDATALAKKAGKGPPKHGIELRVQMPDGKLMWLTRTPYKFRTDAPKRGWVYAVH